MTRAIFARSSFAALAGSVVLSSQARAASNDIPALSFAPFPVPLTRTYVATGEGVSLANAELRSPFPNDFPPCLTIGLQTGREVRPGDRYMMAARNVIRVYNITAVETAPYKTIQTHLEELRKILKARPTMPKKAVALTKRTDGRNILPDYPPRNASHLIEDKLSYVDASWGTGICYVTQFVQGTGEVPDNEELVYLFQGISADDHYFVSADFQITHGKVLPVGEEGPRDSRAADAMTAKIEKVLEKEPDESFTPSLQALRAWINTLQIKEN